MAKVVLVWNEHPTEVVAGFHARKVARILREKYGHEVIMEKIPARETNYGIVQRNIPRRAIVQLSTLSDSYEWAKMKAEKHGATAFNFHASEPELMCEAAKRHVTKFRVGEFSAHRRTKAKSEIEFNKMNNGNFVIEVPGIIAEIPGPKGEVNLARIRNIRRTLGERVDMDAQIVRKRTEHQYHSQLMQLHSPEQQKYLSPVISEKIAAAIHKRISRQSSR